MNEEQKVGSSLTYGPVMAQMPTCKIRRRYQRGGCNKLRKRRMRAALSKGKLGVDLGLNARYNRSSRLRSVLASHALPTDRSLCLAPPVTPIRPIESTFMSEIGALSMEASQIDANKSVSFGRTAVRLSTSSSARCISNIP